MIGRLCNVLPASLCATLAASGVVAQGDPEPVLGQRQIVTHGPDGMLGLPPVVNEPNIVAHEINGQLVLIACWQVGEEPGTNEREVPVRIDYKIGTINPTTGFISWGSERTVPTPSNALDARDPALAVFGKDVVRADRFGSAGVYSTSLAEQFAFVTTADKNSDMLALPQSLHPQQIAWIRMDEEGSNTFEGVLENDLYIIGRSLENTGLIDQFQLAVRRSTDGGLTWGAWEGIEVMPGVRAYGFPSSLVSHGVGDLLFAYMDWEASGDTYLRAMNAAWDGNEPVFGGLSLDLTMNLEVTGGLDYFEVSKDFLAGNFRVGPFADVAIWKDPFGPRRLAYIVYHDLNSAPQGNDGDFDVFLVRGEWFDPFWVWDAPIRVNQTTPHVRSDQFMPTICTDPDGRVHVAWYDTRHDLRPPGQDVKIALYYASIEEDEFGQLQVNEMMVDQEAIHTAYLSNQKSIGDRIDMTARLTNDPTRGVVIVYTGTRHPVSGPGGGGVQPQTINFDLNEVIYSRRIDWITP